MPEKLLLKKTLYDELTNTNSEIIRLYDMRNKQYANLAVIDAKLMILNEHKTFIEKIIDICVQRNKF